MTDFEKVLKEFARVKVLVIGDVMLDRYLWGTATRISPEAPVPIVKLQKNTATLGGAANVAANVAGLGATPLLVGLIGRDKNAEILKEELSKAHISTDFLVETSQRPTITKTRVIAGHQQVARIDEELTGIYGEREADELCRLIAENIVNADIVILSDYAKDCLSEKVISFTIETAGKNNKKVLVDPKGRNFHKYAGAMLLTPNKQEAMAVDFLADKVNVRIEDIGCKIMSVMALQYLLITLGEEGMMLFERQKEPFHIKTETRKVYDVTGAGDTVIATLAVALGAGKKIVEAAELANLCAGIVVEKLGTTAITFEELLKNLRAEKGNR